MNGKMIEQVMQRTLRHQYEDGLIELVSGAIMLLGGGLLYTGYRLWLASQDQVWNSWWPLLGGVLLIGLVSGGGVLLARPLEQVKARVTYPRTGYVAFRKKEQPKRSVLGHLLVALGTLAWTVVVGLLAGWIVGGAVKMGVSEALFRIPVAAGGMLAALLVWQGRRVGLRRFYLLGGVFLFVAVGSVLLESSDAGSTALFLVIAGGVFLVSGNTALWRYLRRYQVVEAGDDD